MQESVTCKLCGKEYKVLGTHLTRINRVSREEYLEMFPGADIVSEATSLRASLTTTEVWKRPEVRASHTKGAQRMWEKPGYREEKSRSTLAAAVWERPSWKKNHKEGCRRFRREHPEAAEEGGRKSHEWWESHPEEKIAASLRAKQRYVDDPNLSVVFVQRVEKWRLENPEEFAKRVQASADTQRGVPKLPHTEEQKRKMVAAWASNYEWRCLRISEGVRKWLQNGGYEKAVEKAAHMRKSSPMYNTAPERVMKSLLQEAGIPYEFQYPMFVQGRGHAFDFAIPDQGILVEVDGCYWHGCPEHYSEHNQEQRERDRRIGEALEDTPWILLRFWEHTLNESPEQVIESLREVIGRVV